ncbi:MAG: T9SS type A sorting domain-containing protein [Flavobacteriales bacterium]|nr:T9SS type A sorting domain-containing protein [Flavobacteriales bacterium]
MHKLRLLVLVICISTFTNDSAAQALDWAVDFNISGQLSPKYEISLDVYENVYVIGDFSDTLFYDTDTNSNYLVSSGSDFFVAKYDSSGNNVWAFNIGETGFNSDGNNIVVNPDGSFYITGSFYGTIDFDHGTGTAILSSNGNSDVFLAKYDSGGNYIWATSFGGNTNDQGSGLTTDSAGNVFVSGRMSGASDFDPGVGTTVLNSNGSYDFFLAKFSSLGDFHWAFNIGGPDVDLCKAIASDGFNVYLTGYIRDSADFDPSASTAMLTTTGGYDIFLAKYDSSGNYLWAFNIGGTAVEFDIGNGLVADKYGHIYMTGSFQNSADFDPGPGMASLTTIGGNDGFLAKYDGMGNYVWAFNYGSTMNAGGSDIGLDASNYIYLLGDFEGLADFDPDTVGAYLLSNGQFDICLAKYDTSGQLVRAFNLGDANQNSAKYLEVLSGGTVYFTGSYSNKIDLDPEIDTVFLIPSSSSHDVFLTRFKPCVFEARVFSFANNECIGGSQGSAIASGYCGMPPYNYSWSNGLNSSSITGLVAAAYYVTITDIYGNVNIDTIAITEPIDTLPVVSFNGLDTGYCVTDAAVTLSGVPAGGIFSGPGVTGDQFDPANSGLGTHIITYFTVDSNNCPDSSVQTTSIWSCTVVEQLTHLKGMGAYPNPARDHLNLTNLEAGGCRFSIYNVLGNLVQRDGINKYSESVIDVSLLSPGLYLIHLYQGTKEYRKKFVKL